MPRITIPITTVTIAALAVASLATVAGCSAPQAEPTSDPVVIVAGSRANAPAPTLTPIADHVVEPALAANKVLGVIIADSTPAAASLTLKDVHGTPAGRANLVKTNRRLITTAMATPPDSNGADDFEAIQIAAGTIKATAKTGTIVLASSALDDTGVMNMTQPNLLDASPTDLVAARRSALDAADLDGITVIMDGLGFTAAPQAPLDSQRRTQLAGLWTAALKAAGAKVVLDTTPPAGRPVRTTKTVKTIPVATTQPEVKTPSCGSTQIVYDQTTPVRFRPDSTAFVDEQAARTTLTTVSSWLTAKPGRSATLVGTTADDGSPQAGQVRLSRDRAQAVAGLLTASGVKASQLSVSGVGSRFPQYTPDRTADGSLDPALAVRNRSVRITLTQTC